MKKIFKLFAVVLTCALVFTGCEKKNDEEKDIVTPTVDPVTVSDITKEYDATNKMTNISFKLNNNTSEEKTVSEVVVELYKVDTVTETITMSNEVKIEANKEYALSLQYPEDVSNYKDIKVKIVK